MSPCVVETSVASLLLRNDSRAAFYRPHIHGAMGSVSFQTLAEMREGAEQANWAIRRRHELEEFLQGFVVVGFSEGIVREWVRIRTIGKRNGRRLEVADAWIAATASVLGAPLLTHDRDFNNLSCPGVAIVRYSDDGQRV